MKQWPKMGNIQVIENEKNLINQFFYYYLLLLFLLGDQKNLDCHINGEYQPCQWLDIWKLVNKIFKKKHLIIWWLKV